MLRSEARDIAEQFAPRVGGFVFDDLRLGEDANGNGEWVARYINGQNEVILERWPDVYTDLDPEPATDREDTTDGNGTAGTDAEGDTEGIGTPPESAQ